MTHRLAARLTCQLTLTALFCWGLVACGGGGGGSEASSVNTASNAAAGEGVAPLPAPIAATAPPPAPGAPAPAPTPTPTPTPTPAPTAPVTGSSTVAGDFSCGLNGAAGIEAEILQRVNALRANGAVCGTTGYAATGALAWNSSLLTAAKGHSADMAQKNYFSHNSLDGRTAGQRVTAAGYNWSTVGENIAGGQTSVEQVMNGWIKSAGHCQNLMNPNFRDVAVACIRNDAADYRRYWTMNLARSR